MMLELVVEHLRPPEREFAKQSHDLTLSLCPVPAVNTTPDVMRISNRPAQIIKPLNPELNPICYLLALLGAHHFLHVSKIRVK